MDRSRRGPSIANPPGAPSSNEEVHSDDEIFSEIEDYAMEVEREERVQTGNPLLYVLASNIWWSEGASSSGGTKPSTNGAPPRGLQLVTHLQGLDIWSF